MRSSFSIRLSCQTDRDSSSMLVENLCMRLRWWCFIQFRNALDYLRHRNRFNASLTMRRRQTFANANETRFSKLNLWYYFDDELITASRYDAKWHILLHCLRTCMHGRHWQQKEVLVQNIPCLAVCERIALDKSFLFRFSFPSWRDSMRSHFEFAREVCASLLGMLNPFQSLPFTIANPISAFIEPSFISIKSNCQSIDIIFQRKLSRITNFDCKVEKPSPEMLQRRFILWMPWSFRNRKGSYLAFGIHAIDFGFNL